MYREGDYIPGVGMIGTNHCGLPWPVHERDGYYYGAMLIAGKDIYVDAMTGKTLSMDEFRDRVGNKNFDYEQKGDNCQEWRANNQPFGPYVPRHIKTKLQFYRWLISARLKRFFGLT